METVKLPEGCLMCRGDRSDALWEGYPYCERCETLRQAHDAALVRHNYYGGSRDPYPDDVHRMYADGTELGQRWNDYLIEYSTLAPDSRPSRAQQAQRETPITVLPVDYVPPPMPDPTRVWRWTVTIPGPPDYIPNGVFLQRIYHKRKVGYLEGWWDMQTDLPHWSLQELDPQMPAGERNAWFSLLRVAGQRGRPHGSASFATEDVFMAACQEAMERRITECRKRGRPPDKRLTQPALAKMLGLSTSRLSDRLREYSQADRSTWKTLQKLWADLIG